MVIRLYGSGVAPHIPAQDGLSGNPLQNCCQSAKLGQPYHPVDLGPGDSGHLPPPILLQTQEKGSSQQAQGHVVVPARPGPGLVLVQVSGKNWRTRFTSARPSGGASPGMAMAAAVLNSTTLGSTKDSGVGVGGVCADPLQCPSTRIHNPRALATRSDLALPPRSRVLIGLM